ncbi:MAG: SPFH domain-containing protein [Oscillospiraceae bacterium]|nr:SPFH domain-containing protein [Oscillospiraceae bacterium]
MGLIKAASGAVGGVLADQWKEFFYCEALNKNVLVAKGQKRITSRSSNTKGNDNIISNGSGIAVADGQCMIIVEQGKVVEVCAEPGEFTYNSSTEPSIFAGSLGKSIIETFKVIGKRFTYGGDTAKDQRVYYFNIKEIIDNKFGTPNPVPFRVVDSRISIDIDVSVRCSGVYSYKITDPLLFYTNVCGNVASEYKREEIDPQLKTEFISALQPAFAEISNLEIRPNQIVAHTTDLENAMNTALSSKWSEKRGISVVSVALGSLTLPEEDQEMIKQLQRGAAMSSPNLAAGNLAAAQADAMRSAASNSKGAVSGFMGMGMAGGMGSNVSSLFQMGAQQPSAEVSPKKAASGETNSWICPKCGASSGGKFCPECGEPKPADKNSWKCSECGAENKGKFCTNCGAKKPADEPLYKCDKCGWEPDDPKNPPKFCPECGDPFDANDITN